MDKLLMILLISLLVLVHEAGHFIAARLCGVRVTRFGIGMPIGPSWKLFRWHNTDFYIHAFLFGGYVAFPDDDNNQDEKDKEDNEILLADSPELYENKTVWQKLFIVSAGVIMNLVFAIILVIFCASVFQKLPTSTQKLYIGKAANESSSNVFSKDIKEGDRIYKVNDMEIKTFYQLQFFLNRSKTFDNMISKENVDKNLESLKKLNPNIEENIPIGTNIVLPKLVAEKEVNVNTNILEGLEKYKTNEIQLSQEQINLRDELENKKTYKTSKEISLTDIAYALSDTYKPIKMTLLRGDDEVNINDVIIGKDGHLGIYIKGEDIYIETKTPLSIIKESFVYSYNTTVKMLFSLWQLFTGKVSASDMHGIIAVVKIGGDIIASKGILNGLLLTAMISINLAIMNFLPIPALDGGHVMFLIIEKITGKKPSKELSDKITNVFFFLLILLMVAICYNDIYALILKKF